MKLLIVALVASMIGVISAGYTEKYDKIDIDEVLGSDRLLNNYCNCLLDKGSCTPDARELKNVLPDALQNGCSKCNEHQKKNAEKVIKFIMKNKPDIWKDLTAKYDPNNVYYNKYAG